MPVIELAEIKPENMDLPERKECKVEEQYTAPSFPFPYLLHFTLLNKRYPGTIFPLFKVLVQFLLVWTTASTFLKDVPPLEGNRPEQHGLLGFSPTNWSLILFSLALRYLILFC